MVKVLGLVTARGGSKGIPGKNWKNIAGKPLIAWTIEEALRSDSLDRVVVSTDHPTIAEVAKAAGADVPFIRPSALAQDESPHIDCVLHALDWLQKEQNYVPDLVCLLQPTSPLRLVSDIDGVVNMAIKKFKKHGVSPVISVTDCPHHPMLVRRVAEDGSLVPFIEHNINYERRQDLPPALVRNGAVYVNTTHSLRKDQTFFPNKYYGYYMPPERSLLIDEDWEFSLVEKLLQMQLERDERAIP